MQKFNLWFQKDKEVKIQQNKEEEKKNIIIEKISKYVIHIQSKFCASVSFKINFQRNVITTSIILTIRRVATCVEISC